jgi:hypothetical protein
MNDLRHALQDEVDRFFDCLHTLHGGFRVTLSKAAFSKARKQLSHTAFIELRQRTNHLYYQESSFIKQWRGHRLLAVDGSKLRLPDEPEVAAHFGRPGNEQAPMALLSGLYDVLNQRWIDAQVAPYASSERDNVVEHLWHTEANDIVLYDRGYPGFWLFALHRDRNRDFCMRVPWNMYNEGRDLSLNAAQTERVITLTPSKEAQAKCKQLGIDDAPLKVRLVKVGLEATDGSTTTEILVTSLFDTEAYPADCFGNLYHQRWAIEEGFKALKCRAELENWSGRCVESILQDIHIKLLTQNLNSMHVAVAEQRRSERNSERKTRQKRRHDHAINRAAALSRQKDEVIALILGKNIRPRIERLIEQISKITEPVRSGRKYLRKKQKSVHILGRKGYKPAR